MRRGFRSAWLAAAAVAAASRAWAAALSPADLADLKRAYASAALASSEAAVVREERLRREPSPGFMLGAALGGWSAAREELAYDLQNPQAAGAPHASQGAANLDAIDQACRDEKAAFMLLEARAAGLGLEPAATLTAAAARDPALLDAWLSRRERAPAC